MKTNEVELTLVGKQYNRKHSFKILQHDGENAVIVVNGKLVATLSVETMEKEVKDDDGDYHTKPSDNFYIQFEAEEAVAKKSCSAMAFVEDVTLASPGLRSPSV